MKIWDWAEIGFQETKSSALRQAKLREAGFAVEAGVAGMSTAITASYLSSDGYYIVRDNFNLNANLARRFTTGLLRGTTVRLGVNNVFDREPPFSADNTGTASAATTRGAAPTTSRGRGKSDTLRQGQWLGGLGLAIIFSSCATA